MNNKIWCRKTASFIYEKEEKQKLLNILYKTVPGRILLKTIFARRWFSVIAAGMKSTRHSAKAINKFVQRHKIDLTNCRRKEFLSFNDFFTRKEIRTTKALPTELIAIADSKLMVYQIHENLCLPIKNSVYTVGELLRDTKLAKAYAGGICLVYRLSLSDYHRHVFSDSGMILNSKKIKGLLHSVRPISEEYRVFARNSREVSILSTSHFKTVIQIEVGAMLAGKIRNHKKTGSFCRMEEKGYFSYGGSTIVQLFVKDSIILDNDILEHSGQEIESKVTIGEKIGYAKKTKHLF